MFSPPVAVTLNTDENINSMESFGVDIGNVKAISVFLDGSGNNILLTASQRSSNTKIVIPH